MNLNRRAKIEGNIALTDIQREYILDSNQGKVLVVPSFVKNN